MPAQPYSQQKYSDAQIAKKVDKLSSDLQNINIPFKNGNTIPYVFKTSGVEEAVKHGLNRPPQGFIIHDVRSPGHIYRGTTRVDNNNIYLKSDTNGADVDILVF